MSKGKALFCALIAVPFLFFVGCGGDDDNNPTGGGGDYTYTGRTVTIGGQTWMAENLNRNTSNSWCYDNDNSNCAKYGRLYTWNAAMSACPSGWHLPSRAEWDDLESFVGSNAGKKLKSTTGWDSNSGTDDYGFSALPGGFRYYNGASFRSAGGGGYWWSATGGSYAYSRVMYNDYDTVDENYNLEDYGFSVRCVQN